MSATIALFRKELRQHGPTLVGITVLLAAVWLIGLAVLGKDARVLSTLQMVPTFGSIALSTAALYLGHRLVVVEYYGRTQRFVESLPVRRGHLTAVKALFGLLWMALWAGAALLAGVAAARTEVIEPRFVQIMGARLGLFVFALWGVVFAFGFFGRLRVPLALAGVFLLFALDRNTGFRVMGFGPLALIDPATFPYERQHFPVRALLQAAAVGAGAILLTLLLSRVREGSVVEALARRLSARELSALLVMLAGGATLWTTLARDPPPPPYRITTDKMVASPGGNAQVAYLEDELRPGAQVLAGELESRLRASAELLGLPAWPTVRVVHAPELPLRRPRAIRNEPDGLVMRANLRDLRPDDRANIIFRVIHRLVWDRSRGRAGVEARHWLLDGFAFNVARHGQPAPTDDALDPQLLRALAAVDRLEQVGRLQPGRPFDAAVLTDYQQTSELLGDELADALAASGWRVLAGRAGPQRARALARAALAYRGTGDVRDTWHDWRHPVPALIAQSTGVAWETFLQAWGEALSGWRRLPAAEAALRTLPRAALTAQASARDGVGATGTLEQPLASDLGCTLRHLRLPPYDAEVDDDRLEELGFLWPRGATSLNHRAEGSYGRGERAFVALECDLPALGCPVRLLGARVTVR